ncbi:toxic anion resistance protein [Thaumasiovibrio subtropicus]|uniref:toxic anion resistance protein n=1 Tax=Thaumasiovibrio subtropicus TaxID=1891207 RepID=UPI00131E05A0|nr:toxic anion resistance protein [Thaumasiovibrio subtropicus]
MTTITLTPPEPVAVVEQEKAAGMVPMTDAQRRDIDKRVADFLTVMIDRPVGDAQFQSSMKAIHAMGSAEIQRAAGMSNRMLERPAVAAHKMSDASPVGESLLVLRETIEDLDPSKQGGSLLSPRKLLGLIPFGNKLKAYFRRYESAQSHINGIIEGLLNGKDELAKDNAAIEVEKAQMWELMGKLEQYVHMGKEIDRLLAANIIQIEAQDAEKARVVKEEVLFYVRQKVQDLLTQLASSVQGYLALDLIRKNNLELIKGVDRATTTTVGALRTAVMVAQALNNQKLVLNQINALNKTTGDMIAGTASMLKQQAADIGQQAASTTIDLDKLQGAFNDIYETFDAMSTYKAAALESMQRSVDVLSDGIEKAKPLMREVNVSSNDATLQL